MALTFNGTSSTVQTASKSVGSFLPTSFPFTIFCWVKQGSSPPAVGIPFAFQADAADTGASNHIAGIRTNPATALQAYTSTGSVVSVNATQAASPGSWVPAMAVFNSSSSRNIHFGTGAAVNGTGTASINLSAFGWCYIGLGTWKGDIACCAIWDSALTLSDFQTLGGSAGGGSGGGVVPSTVSSGTLREYWSLLTQASTHTGVNGRVLTATSTTQAADHPITESVPSAFTAGATLGAVVAGGSMQSVMSGFTAAAILGAVVAGGSLGPTPGTFVLGPIRVNGVAQNGAAIDWVRIYSDAGILLYERTGGTLDGSGSTTLTTSAAPPGTAVRIDWQLSSGRRRMPRVTMG